MLRLILSVWRRVGVLALVLVLAAVGLFPATAFAADTRSDQNVIVPADQTVNDDLYVAGNSVTILGTVNGDLIAMGNTVTINGAVNGSVLAAGQTVTIQGPVAGTVRAAGQTVTVASKIGRDLLAAGTMVTIQPQASIGHDLLVGGNASIDGAVGRDVSAWGSNLTLNAPVGGNVKFEGNALQLGSRATVAGNLNYTADSQIAVPQNVVKGNVQYQVRAQPTTQPVSPLAVITGGIIGWARALIGLTILGLILVLGFPRFSRKTTDALQGSPWASLGIGFAALVAVPLAALIVFLVGLGIGGWWLGVVAMGIYGLALALGTIVGGLFVGDWIFARFGRASTHAAWKLVVGLAALLLVAAVPVVGGLVMLAAMVFGLGALLIGTYRAYRGEPTVATLSSQPEPEAPALGAAA